MTENISLDKMCRHICRHHILHTEHLFPSLSDCYQLNLCSCITVQCVGIARMISCPPSEFYVSEMHHI